MQRIKEPDILDFDHFQDYFSEIVRAKKAGGRGWTLRRLAEQANIQSPSFLTMVLKGERTLSSRTATQICQALGLKGRRRKYFFALVELDAAKSDEEKVIAQGRAQAIRLLPQLSTLEKRQLRFFSNWYYPVVYVMVGMDRIDQHPKKIAATIGRGVRERDVFATLKDLVELGLIREEGGRYVQTLGPISGQDDISDLGYRKFHKKMIELSLSAPDFPLEERELSTLTIGIPKRLLPKVKEKIRQIRKEMNEELSRHDDAEVVYQINMQLFPITKKQEKIQ